MRTRDLPIGGSLIRGFFTGLLVAIAGSVVVAVPIGYLRWSAKRTAAALAEAHGFQEAGDLAAASIAYDRYSLLAGMAADPDAIVDRALVALEVASAADATPTQVSRAIEATNTAIRRRSADVRLRQRLAELQLDQGNFLDAREHLVAMREAVGQTAGEGDLAEIDLRLARTWLGTGDHPRAMKILADLTGFMSDSRSFAPGDPVASAPPEAYLLLADILRDRLGDKDAAARVVERCATAHPDEAAALVPLVSLLLSRNEPQAALETACRAATLAPSDSSALVARAQALMATGDVLAAGTALTEAVRRCPADSFALTMALRYVPGDAPTEQMLALIDAAMGQLPKHENDMLAFLARMTLDEATLPEFARALEGAAEKLEADHPVVTVLRARLLAAQGRCCAAEKPLLEVRAIVPAHAKGQIDASLGQCLATLGDYDEALVVYQRLEQDPFLWWRGCLGVAEMRLALGQRAAAAEAMRKLEIRAKKAVTAENVAGLFDVIIPTLSLITRVTAAQPVGEQDWSFVDRRLELLQATPEADTSPALAVVRAERLAAEGDIEGALAVLPASTATALPSQADPLRLSLIVRSDGIEAMRAALADLPESRRDRGQVLEAVARAEALHATGDERDWLRSIASAAERITDGPEAVQLLDFLAGLATRAGWPDEARALWTRAAERLPKDFRAPLALALDSARRGDAAAAAKALGQIDAIEEETSSRRRLAAAAALVAAVRSTRGENSAPLPDAQRKQLDEARALLRGARDVRKRWQAIAALSFDVESLAGDHAAACAQIEQAVAWGPRDPGLIREFATSLARNRRLAEAEALMDLITPAGIPGGDRLAIDLLLEDRDYPAAADRAMSVVDPASADTATLTWLGRLCLRAGMRAQAADVFTRATRIDPSNSDVWISLARFRMSEGDADAAAAAIAAGLDSVAEDNRRLLSARGAAALGRTAEAEREFRDGVRQARGDAGFAACLVDHLIEWDRDGDARAFLEEVIAGRWGDRKVLLLWARSRLAGLRDGAWR